MALILKKETINSNGGQVLPIGVIVRFQPIGTKRSNNFTFDLEYRLNDDFGVVNPLIEKEVTTIDLEGNEVTKMAKVPLPKRFRSEKTMQEIKAIADSFETDNFVAKVALVSHALVKEKLEILLGVDSVEIDLEII